MLFGPGLFSLTFAYFIAPEHRLPGAPWYLAAILMLVSLALAWAVARENKSGKNKDKDKDKDKDAVGGGLLTAEAD